MRLNGRTAWPHQTNGAPEHKFPAFCVAESVRNHTKAGNQLLLLALFGRQQQEVQMPVFILWAGIPILILGGGFVVYRIIGG
jgi:hypothetical protein